jgi:Na+/phosphate symporter
VEGATQAPIIEFYRGGKWMNEQEYLQTLNKVLDAMISCMEQMIKCLPSYDKKCIELADKEFITAATASLPMADRLTKLEKKDELETKFLNLLPTIQRIGLAMDDVLSRIKRKTESGLLFTDKGNAEILDIMRRVRDLIRDTKDYYATKNPTLYNTGKTHLDDLVNLVHKYADEHQQRMISGICTPRTSYVYVDMMESLKRMATQLARLATKA